MSNSNFIQIKSFNDPRWIQFINVHPGTILFHQPEWLELLHRQYGFKICIMAMVEGDKIKAAIPFCEIKSIINGKKWVSLPFTDYCPPLYSSSNDLDQLLKSVLEKAKQQKIKSIEIRYPLNGVANFEQISEQVIHKLSLKNSYVEIRKNYHPSHTLRSLAKARKSNLQVEKQDNIEGIKDFYKLHVMTRKKLGVPVQPFSFFKGLLNIIKSGKGTIYLVKHEDQYIASAIFLWANKTFIYKFGASNPKYLNLRPNHIIFDEAIQLAHKNGFEYFDFGKTDNYGSGLRQFKHNWGSKENPLFFSYFPTLPKKGFLMMHLFPIVQIIIRKSPKFICKIIGKLFYKYAV